MHGQQNIQSTPFSHAVSWLPITRYLVSIFLYSWKSLIPVYIQPQNTHHALLHNSKYFFKSLYYNSGTLTARSCSIFSKCNRVADKNLTQLKISDKCIYIWVLPCSWKNTYWSHTCDWTFHIIQSNTCAFPSSTNSQQCYNKMWIAMQTQNCLLQIFIKTVSI